MNIIILPPKKDTLILKLVGKNKNKGLTNSTPYDILNTTNKKGNDYND